MEHVSIEGTESSDRPGATVKRLAEALGTEDVAINHYHLEPGENFAGGMHTHMDQEEVFYVTEGTATFETPEGETTVKAGELVRFAPGEYQQGRNDSGGVVEALALGAPKESSDVRVPMPCPECESEDLRAIPAEDGFSFECPECAAEVDSPPV
jgi:uncharacterized cupin superfamily protein